MAKLPEGWIVADLGEFCEGIRGVTYKPDDLVQVKTEKTITLLRSNNIKAGALNFKDVQHVAQKNVNQKQVAQLGDIAVCMSNGSKRLVGKSAAFKHIPEGRRYTVGSFCSIFRPLESACPVFVEQVFCSDEFQRQVDFSLAGSAINNLKNSDLIAYQFLKPPLPEQQKIATILTSVDTVIEKTRAQIDKLKDLKTGMMQELLTQGIGHTEFKDSPVGRIPKSWEVKILRELVTIKHGYAFEGEFFSSSPTPYILLTPGNFNRDGRLYFGSKTKYYDGPIPDEYILNNGDVLVVMTDLTKEMTILGNSIILKSDAIVLHNQRIGKVEALDENILEKEYLCFVMNSENVKAHIKDTATGTTVRHTSPTKILESFVPLPSATEQLQIINMYNSLDSRLSTAENKLQLNMNLKKALMQDLLTGKVRISRINYE